VHKKKPKNISEGSSRNLRARIRVLMAKRELGFKTRGKIGPEHSGNRSIINKHSNRIKGGESGRSEAEMVLMLPLVGGRLKKTGSVKAD